MLDKVRLCYTKQSIRFLSSPNFNYSSSLSPVSSTSTSVHKAVDYEKKGCAPVLESDLEEKCADLVVFNSFRK